jgi:hypothetical protein
MASKIIRLDTSTTSPLGYSDGKGGTRGDLQFGDIVRFPVDEADRLIAGRAAFPMTAEEVIGAVLTGKMIYRHPGLPVRNPVLA